MMSKVKLFDMTQSVICLTIPGNIAPGRQVRDTLKKTRLPI